MSFDLDVRGWPPKRVNDLVEADAVLVIDCSGSMRSTDAGPQHDEQRWTVMNNVAQSLLARLSGKLVVVAFNTDYQLVDGDLPEPGGGTDVGKVLAFLGADRLGTGESLSSLYERVVLISDGEPTVSSVRGLDPEEAAIEATKTLRCPLDVVYVGPRTCGPGELFLSTLAKMTGGQCHERVLDSVEKLTDLLFGMLALTVTGEETG
jgi:hypothetical protein